MNRINRQYRKTISKRKIEGKLKTMIIVGFLFFFLIFEVGNSSFLVEKNSDSNDISNNDLIIDSPMPSDIVADEYFDPSPKKLEDEGGANKPC